MVPTEGLAVVVAQEWGAQGAIIKQPLMHLVMQGGDHEGGDDEGGNGGGGNGGCSEMVI